MENPSETPNPARPEETATQGTERKGWFSARKRVGSSDSVSAEAAPPPPAPKKKKRRAGLIALFSGMMTLMMVLALAIAGSYAYMSREFRVPGPLAADKTVIIERGASTEDIADLLEKEGVISRPGLFYAAMIMTEIQSKFSFDEGGKKRAKAGEYLFQRQASMSDVLDTIASGRSIEHTLTFPEGLTSEQIIERLRENPLLTGDVGEVPPEGSLLPDTYKINRGTPRTALIARMQAAQRKVLQDVWNRRAKDLPLKNPRELVILASIVEKETGRADERTRVAGVFYNRLGKNMRLQSDPTIVYGIVGGKGTLGRAISRADIDKPTPYNTYTINGLPPGPIANPGKAALEATANPSRTKEIFFVADGTGGHVFAETLEQHNRNVARWRQIEAQRAASGATDPAATTPGTDGPRGFESGFQQLQRAPESKTPDAGTGNPAAPPSGAAPATPPRGAIPAVPPRSGLSLDRSTYDLNAPKTVPNF
ncbi:MAG: endolytic transglycosylase MltG [Proteobacteria bacterium]|nr:endolytic transglycosylase MltG [Pseudomonadota bacterium]